MESTIPQTLDQPITTNGIKTIFSKIIFIFFIVIGLKGIWDELLHIFFIYPNLPQTLFDSTSGQLLYTDLLKKILFLSVSNFLATTYGLAMLFKPSHLIKTLHYVTGSVILGFLVYVNNNYQLPPDIETLIRIINP